MKLRQKISCICGAILVAVVLVMGGTLLHRSKQNILQLTYEQAEDRQKNLASSFSEMANYYIDAEDSPAVEYSLVIYCFSRFADSTSVLTRGDEILYSQVNLQLQDYFNENTGRVQRYTGKIQGREILIVRGEVSVRGVSYFVYVVEDISAVYQSIGRLTWQFAGIGGLGIVIGLVLIFLSVRKSLSPLAELKQTAGSIAAGNYGERAEIAVRDEVGALAESFNLMAEAVEEHINELTETAERQRMFIGGVTHEFKTPLTTVILNADTLQNAYLSEEERDTALSYIERQCRWLERMTQKLLKLITLKQEIGTQRISAAELFRRAEESVSGVYAGRGTLLAVECGEEYIQADPDLMLSVIINLLDNASKASDPGQRVFLSARENIIEVRDEGIGIPESELARITEPFYMVDKSRSKKLGGSGLGLALVKEIVYAHGAELRITSQQGKGTTVRICFKKL